MTTNVKDNWSIRINNLPVSFPGGGHVTSYFACTYMQTYLSELSNLGGMILSNASGVVLWHARVCVHCYSCAHDSFLKLRKISKTIDFRDVINNSEVKRCWTRTLVSNHSVPLMVAGLPNIVGRRQGSLTSTVSRVPCRAITTGRSKDKISFYS